MYVLKMTADKFEKLFGKYWWVLGLLVFFGFYLAIVVIQLGVSQYNAIPVSAATPSDPQGLILTAGDTEVSLSWSLPADDGAQDNWYNSNWLYRKPITIDPSMVVGGVDLLNFPALINITEADLIGEAQLDADDIIFTLSDGTTRLEHEIESFNPATGELQAWVQIPTLSASLDTDLFMYYSNPSATSLQNPVALWANYDFVYHFGEGSGTTVADSSPNGYDATLANTSGWTSGGVLGNSFDFEGLPSANNPTIYTIKETGTFSAWFNLTNNALSGEIFYAEGTRGRVRYVSGEVRFELMCFGSATNEITGVTFNNGQWYQVASQYNHLGFGQADFNNYLDGTLHVGGTTNGCSAGPHFGTMNLGNNNTNTDDFAGVIDEVRFTNDELTADWIATEYENMANNTTHISIGTEEQYESGVITDYVIEYRVVGAPSYTTFSDGVSAATTALVTGLANGTDYEFRVAAVNSTGTGAPTAAQQSTPSGTPLAASDLNAVAGAAEASLTWSAPNNNGNTITDYIVEYKETAQPTYSVFNDGVSAATGATITGLANGTSYDFRIAAVNAQGQGAYSNVDSATPVDVPLAIGDLGASGSDSEVDLSWSAPGNNGSAITDYIIEYKETAQPTYSIFADGTSASTAVTVTGLNNGVSYDFRVSAVNSVGQGPISNVASATPTPAATAPSAVQNLAGAVGEEQVVLTWNAPASDGGAAITDYVVSYRETGMPGYSSYADGVTSITGTTVTGLTAGTSYDFRVAAVNSVGTGPNTDITGFTPYRTLGSADIPGLTMACASAQINSTTTCSFNLATHILLPGDFQVSIGAGTPAGGCSRVGTTVTCNNIPTGVSVGSQAIYGWTASIQTNSGETVNITSVPGAVQNLNGTAGEQQVTLTWNAPATNGGLTITDYRVSYKEDSDSLYSVFADGVTATTGATVTGLVAGITYDFRVEAINANGAGPAADINGITPFRTLSTADIPGLTFSCNPAQINSTTTCTFSLPTHILLPGDFQISIGSAAAVGGCSRAGTTVTCASVPTGSSVGTHTIFAWTSSTQTNTGETVSITAVATSSSTSSATSSSATTTTSSSTSTTTSTISSTSSTTTDIPVSEERPQLDEDDIDRTQVSCGEVQQSGTTDCEVKMPPDVAPPVLGISIKVGENGGEKECVYNSETNSYNCYDVPVGDIIGSIPIFIRIGTGDLINTAARVIVRSVLAVIDFRDIKIQIITDDGEPAVNLLEEFIVKLEIQNNTDEIQTRLKLTQQLPSQIVVVDGSLTSLSQVLPADEIRVSTDNVLSTGEFNLAPGQVMGIEYRARVVNDDTLQLNLFAQLQSNVGIIRSETVELLVIRSSNRIWWLFVICLLLLIVGAGVAIYLYLKNRKNKDK